MTDHYIRAASLPALSIACLVAQSGARHSAVSVLLIVAALATACSGGQHAASPTQERTAGTEPRQMPWEQPVPKAECGADDRPETALQGQVPLTDRGTGRSLEGYSCNLERVGHHQGDGTGWQMAWFDDCVYYGTASHFGASAGNFGGDVQAPGRPRENPGVVVADVSDSTDPQVTAFLDTPAMIDPWESLKTHEARQLLAGINAQAGSGGPEFDVYDISGDCTQPELLVSEAVGTLNGHAGNFAADGMTYYGADTGENIRAIGIEDPTSPELLTDQFPWGTHDLSTNADGTRLYLAVMGNAEGSFPGPNGLAILDVSEIQERQPDPLVDIVTEFFWDDGAIAQMTQPITIDDTPYILFVDEGGSGLGPKYDFCARGLPPFAFARLIDISDEQNPVTVSKLMLETHDPANCAQTINDDQAIFLYDAHYCSVDDRDDAKLLACSYFESGLRIFDIRDPYQPREIAYYNAPLTPGYWEGSYYNTTGTCHTADWAGAHPRFVLERNEIWYTGQCTGLNVLRFTQPWQDLLGPPPE